MQPVLLESFEQFYVIALNRPEAKNAISLATLKLLNTTLDTIEADKKCRGVIFSGGESDVFCAGADLKERSGFSEEDTYDFVTLIQSTCNRVAKLTIPTIAAMNGHAFGGGLELALACDIRVGDEGAQFGLTECSLGILPGAGGTQRLPRIVGYSRALDLILGAKRIDAKEAHRIGLIDYLAEKEHAMEVAKKVMAAIGKNAPLAVKAAKKAIQASQVGSDQGLKAELAAYREILPTRDRKEGFTAFKEKRAPRFIGE